MIKKDPYVPLGVSGSLNRERFFIPSPAYAFIAKCGTIVYLKYDGRKWTLAARTTSPQVHAGYMAKKIRPRFDSVQFNLVVSPAELEFVKAGKSLAEGYVNDEGVRFPTWYQPQLEAGVVEITQDVLYVYGIDVWGVLA